MAEHNFPITRILLKSMVLEILTRKGIKVTPSKKWYQRFIKKNGLLSKMPKHVNRGRFRAANTDNIASYFDLLQSVLDKFDLIDQPELIFNVDETGFSEELNTQTKAIVPVGQRPITRQIFTNDHSTSVYTISETGQVLSPMVIFTRSVPVSLRNMELGNWIFRSTKSGFIDTKLFLEWFRDIFLKEAPVKRPLLLILDAHSTHVGFEFVELAKKENVEVLSVPSKTSDKLQPLDQIFSLLKGQFSNLVLSLKLVKGDILVNQGNLAQILQLAIDQAWTKYTLLREQVLLLLHNTLLYSACSQIDIPTCKHSILIIRGATEQLTLDEEGEFHENLTPILRVECSCIYNNL